jgi:hypothetical protein
MEDSECELFLSVSHSHWKSLYSISPTAVATARVLTQALSNTVTANDALVVSLWETYMNLPEDQVVLMSVLSYPWIYADDSCLGKIVDYWDLQILERS